MGNDNAKSQGHSLQGGAPRASSSVETAEERQKRLANAEQRLAKGRPTRTQESTKSKHFAKYEEIERQANSRGGGGSVKCPLCSFSSPAEDAIARHFDSAHGGDKPAPTPQSKRPASPASPTNPLSDSDSNLLVCPICSRELSSEAHVDLHMDREHSATASDRELRAKLAEKRLQERNRKGKGVAAVKDAHWQRYNSLGNSSEPFQPEQKDEKKTEEELARELDVDLCLKNMVESNLGRPEVLQTTISMIVGIFQKILHPPDAEQSEKFRKFNVNNEKVQERIVKVSGAVELLKAIGFKVVALPAASGSVEDYYFLQSPNPKLLEYAIAQLKAKLSS